MVDVFKTVICGRYRIFKKGGGVPAPVIIPYLIKKKISTKRGGGYRPASPLDLLLYPLEILNLWQMAQWVLSQDMPFGNIYFKKWPTGKGSPGYNSCQIFMKNYTKRLISAIYISNKFYNLTRIEMFNRS